MIQGTEEWHLARLGKVTASRISDVMMKPTTQGYQNYRSELILERMTGIPADTVSTAAMRDGTETEPRARASYELITGQDVQETGFIQHPKLAFAGASPDGLVGLEGGLEIKCPQPAKHIKNLTGAAIDRGYLLQMQWNMACTGREWWDFASFNAEFPNHLRIHIQRVPRDAEMIEEITGKVTTFLADVDRLMLVLEAREAA